MNSALPKVLHVFKSRPMVDHVIDVASSLDPTSIVIVTGFEAQQVETHVQSAFSSLPLQFVRQLDQKGTADALACLFPFFENRFGKLRPPYLNCRTEKYVELTSSHVLVLLGDTPRLESQGIAKFCNWFLSEGDIDLAVLATEVPDPTGYGRVSEDLKTGTVSIIEEKDATASQKVNCCINTGIFMAKTQELFTLLKDVTPSNSAGEYYATDIFLLAERHGLSARRYVDSNHESYVGINTIAQLSQIEGKS